MSLPLSESQEAEYAQLIDDILAKSDLNTVSAKVIRQGLQEHVQQDLAGQKKSITALIMARFDKFNASNDQPASKTSSSPPTSATNGTKSASNGRSNGASHSTSKKRTSSSTDEDEENGSLSSPATTPPVKRAKFEQSHQESDAAYAKRLQAELNRVNARSTRGGGTTKRKPVVKKQTRKKKSKDRVDSDDDSGAEGGEKKEVKRTGGFHKEMALSPALSSLLNETKCSRPQTVKKIWQYIKERDLQDPADKRQIICDDAMRNVFKTDKVHMFTMNKVINQHLYEVEE